jgi:integrase
MATLTGQRSHLCDMVTLAINTGLRVNELFGLKREDVDFHRDVLYIKHTKTDEDREVPLNDSARELLRGLIQTERKSSEFLFTNPKVEDASSYIKLQPKSIEPRKSLVPDWEQVIFRPSVNVTVYS